jgi:hypothetical protein
MRTQSLPDQPPPSNSSAEIPAALRSRLAADGVVSLRKWARLTERQKTAVFGITERHRRLLDELARGAP